MKKSKIIISLILILTLLVPVMSTPALAAIQDPGPVSVGLSELVINVCNYVVGFYNDYGVSVVDMMRQGEKKEGMSDTTYNLTNVRVTGEKIDGLFNDVTSKFYPKLMMISIIVFLAGLIYIGVLTIMSSAAAKRHEYMTRLKTWFTGLILLLAFGIIMVFLIKVNNALANTFLDIGQVEFQPGSSTTMPGVPSVNKCDAFPNQNVTLLTLINDVRAKGNTSGTYDVSDESGQNGVRVKVMAQNFDGENNDEYIDWFYWHKSDDEGEADKYGFPAGTCYETLKVQKITDFQPGWVNVYNYYRCEMVPYTGQGGSDYALQFYLDAKKVYEKIDDAGETFHENKTRALNISDFASFTSTETLGWDSDVAKVNNTALTIWFDGDKANDKFENMGGNVEPNDPILKELYNEYFVDGNNGRIEYALLYAIGVFQTFMIFIVYVMRTFMISFLVLIFPIIMAIYCLDKINDNKSSVFTKWLKEYISNVFTNSVHALSYGIMFSVILMGDGSNGGDPVHPMVKIIALWFILPSGKILRGIFQLESKGADMSDRSGVAMLAGMAALASKGAGGFQSTSNNINNSVRANLDNRRKQLNGGGGSGGDGGGSGSGGEGSSGGMITGMTGSGGRVKGAGGGSLVLGGIGSLLGMGVTAAGAATGAVLGVAHKAASGENFGDVLQGATVGGVIGGGLAKGGLNVAAASVGGAQHARQYLVQRSQNKKELQEQNRIATVLQGQSQELARGGVPEIRQEITAGQASFYRPVAAGASAVEGSRVTHTLGDGTQREFLVQNGHLYDESAGEYLYNSSSFASTEGNFSSVVGVGETASLYMPVDINGTIDPSQVRVDHRTVNAQVERQFEAQTSYVRSSINEMVREFGIEEQKLSVESNFNAANTKIEQKFVAGEITQEQRDSGKNRLVNVRNVEERLDKDKADETTNRTKNIHTKVINSDLLRPLMKSRSIDNT